MLAQFREGAPGHLLYVKIAKLFLNGAAGQAVVSCREAGQKLPGPLGLNPEIEGAQERHRSCGGCKLLMPLACLPWASVLLCQCVWRLFAESPGVNLRLGVCVLTQSTSSARMAVISTWLQSACPSRLRTSPTPHSPLWASPPRNLPSPESPLLSNGAFSLKQTVSASLWGAGPSSNSYEVWGGWRGG